jgi:hypothetical protein
MMTDCWFASIPMPPDMRQGGITRNPPIRRIIPADEDGALYVALDDQTVAGAGSSAGVDLTLLRENKFQRLHTRRLDGAVSAMTVLAEAHLIAAADYEGRMHLWSLGHTRTNGTLKIANGA